jgi:hypothetical protein
VHESANHAAPPAEDGTVTEARAAAGGATLVSTHAQLTYTAVGSSGHPGAMSGGGWQVKQASPSLTREETEALLAGVTTRMSLPRSLPQFPSAADLAAMPVRLCYRPSRFGGLFWHSVPAGPDATGRPDNVFTHAMLDRMLAEPAAARPVRPIELWRSPRWLSPYGAQEVSAAEFDDAAPPDAGQVVTRSAVVDFLFESGVYRFATVALLLDAVAAALSGGPPVLVVAPTVDEGALWVGVASHLSAPASCARLSFSSFERADAVDAVTTLPLLSVVLEEDTTQLPQAGLPVVVVKTGDEPRVQSAPGGDVWVLRKGPAVPVTEWSRMAMDICALGPAGLSECLAAQDDISASVGWRPEGVPYWCLAVAVAQRRSLELSWSSAARVVLEQTPPDLHLPPPVRDTLRKLIAASAGSAPQDAWSLLTVAVGSGEHAAFIVQLAFLAYLERALRDEAWLLGETPPPLPAAVPHSEALRGEVVRQAAGSVRALRQRPLAEAGVTGAVVRLRLLDFLTRLDLLVRGVRESVPELDALASDVVPFLNGGLADELVTRVGAVHDRTLAGWILPELAVYVRQVPAAPGQRMSASLARWLAPGVPAAELALPAGRARHLDPVLEEVLLHSPRADQQQLAAAVARLVVSPYWMPGDDEPMRLGAAMQAAADQRGSVAWSAAGWIALARRSETAASPALVELSCRRLAYQTVTSDSSALAAALLDAHAPEWWHRSNARIAGVADEGVALLYFHAIAVSGWFLQEDGYPSWSLDLLHHALHLWDRAADKTKAVLAPHLLVALIEIRVALSAWGPASADLRSHAQQLPALRSLHGDVLALGLPDAADMVARLFTESSVFYRDFIDVAAKGLDRDHDGARSWHDFLLTPLTATDGEPLDLAAALLRHHFEVQGRDQRAVVREGNEQAERVGLDKAHRDRFLAWWDSKVLSAGPSGSLHRITFRRRDKP